MKDDQKYMPKYWVVHDKETDDVFIDTADKSQGNAIELFLDKHAYSYFGLVTDESVMECYLGSDKLECILIEIVRKFKGS